MSALPNEDMSMTDKTDVVERLERLAAENPDNELIEVVAYITRLRAELEHEKKRRRAIDDEAFSYSEQLAELRAEVARLEAEKAEADANQIAALDLVSRIRFALGDNGKRMQDELIIYCTEAVKDAERYRVGHDRYERVRRMTPRRFRELCAENIVTGKPFDQLVDELKPFAAMRGDREDG